MWISIRLLDVEVNIRVEHPRAFRKKRHKSLCLTNLLNKPRSKWKMNLMLKEILARIQHKWHSTRTNKFFLTYLSGKSRSLSVCLWWVCVCVCVCGCVCVWVRERQRDSERQTQRQQRERETERQIETEPERRMICCFVCLSQDWKKTLFLTAWAPTLHECWLQVAQEISLVRFPIILASQPPLQRWAWTRKGGVWSAAAGVTGRERRAGTWSTWVRMRWAQGLKWDTLNLSVPSITCWEGPGRLRVGNFQLSTTLGEETPEGPGLPHQRPA